MTTKLYLGHYCACAGICHHTGEASHFCSEHGGTGIGKAQIGYIPCPAPIGWRCPNYSAGLSPSTPCCPFCPPKKGVVAPSTLPDDFEKKLERAREWMEKEIAKNREEISGGGK